MDADVGSPRSPAGTGADPEPLLRVEGLTVEVATSTGWRTVVDDVELDIGSAEVVGLVGESGSGKTMTGLSLLRLLPPRVARISSGRVRLAGRDLLDLSERQMEDVRGDEVAMIFQEPMTSLNPGFTVGDQVGETLRRHRGLSRRATRGRVAELLSDVGIPNAVSRLDDYPHQFSGGMAQRVMVAMALACDPALLVADEPTTALDVTIQAQVLELLRRLCAERHMAMLLISHDLGVVADTCDRVQVMYGGQIVESADVVALYGDPRHPYTEGLLHSTPRLDGQTGPHALVPGIVDANARGRCRLAPRCPYADERCWSQDPPLEPTGSGLVRCLRWRELDLQGVVE